MSARGLFSRYWYSARQSLASANNCSNENDWLVFTITGVTAFVSKRDAKLLISHVFALTPGRKSQQTLRKSQGILLLLTR